MILRRRLTNRVQPRFEANHLSMGDGRHWYRIENATSGIPAQIYLYDEIGLWGVTAAEFVNQLGTIDAAHIDLHINSPGGDVFDGVAIYNALCNHPATITTYVDGLAASAASFIAQAGGQVLIARNGTMMIHDAEGICIGNCADMAEMADLLDRASNNIADIYAQRAGTVLQWRKKMKAMNWYTGQEAVDAGLADATYQPDAGTDEQPIEKRRPNGKAQSPQPVANVLLPQSRIKPTQFDTACPSHTTDTADGTWDAGQQTSRLPSPVPLADAKKVYAWYDSERVDSGEIPKDGCKLPHHEIDADGNPGAANLNGVRNALSRLPQSDIPSDEQDAVRSHLQKHLDDAPVADDAVGIGTQLIAAWDPNLFKESVTIGARAALEPNFNPDVFRLAMSAAGVNAPAIQDDPPARVELPPLPSVPVMKVCNGCDRPLEAVDGVLSPGTIRQIMHDVTMNAPALADDVRNGTDLGDRVPGFDRGLFDQSLRRGLL